MTDRDIGYIPAISHIFFSIAKIESQFIAGGRGRLFVRIIADSVFYC